MISVSDNQLRIVAEAADLLPAEARGTFLRRVVAEVREGRSFKDSDIERAVRVALLDQSMKRTSVSSTDQGGGKRRSDTPSVFSGGFSVVRRVPPTDCRFSSPKSRSRKLLIRMNHL